MDDLIAFLREQWDAEEADALAASEDEDTASWYVKGTWHLEGVEHTVVGNDDVYCYPHNAAHIARHDPARVLADVEAKRRILDQYAEALRIADGFREIGWEEGRREALELACRALALPYADVDGYREEWKP